MSAVTPPNGASTPRPPLLTRIGHGVQDGLTVLGIGELGIHEITSGGAVTGHPVVDGIIKGGTTIGAVASYLSLALHRS
jgi:hypothetical protein